jgi:hypothetical protein
MHAPGHRMLALGFLMVLLSACSSSATPAPTAIPAGTVIGTLVDGNGTVVVSQDLWLLQVESGSKYKPTDHRTSTDSSGRFVFDKLDAGIYAIVLDPGDPMKLDLNGALLRGSGGGSAFELPASNGLDLGTQTTRSGS